MTAPVCCAPEKKLETGKGRKCDMNEKKELAYQRLSPAYETSMLNPGQAEKSYPGLGAWYAALQAEIAGSYEDECLGKKALAAAKEWLAEEAAALFKDKREESPAGLKAALSGLWKRYLLRTAEARALDWAKEMTRTGAENPYEAVLRKANADTDSWMEEYGLPVTALEREMMRFWFSLPPEKLKSMGNIIADALLHGFISQSRDRRGRSRVRFFYQLGQEALAREVVRAFRERGLQPVITAPHTLDTPSQYQVDHRFDRYYGLDQELLAAEQSAYEKAMRGYEAELKDTCGMVGIEQFGIEPVILTPCPDALHLTQEMQALSAQLESWKAELEAEWIRPAEISFCKIAFPNRLVGERFEEIFQDFFAMNETVSEPYELVQQTLIDALDTCEYAEVKGYQGNETNITVSLWPLSQPDVQTKFLNCGGDLNIPYGEVFTTPRLAGTTGLWHVEEICLKGVFYHDLRLTFKDGWVIRADCREGAEYVRKNLLYPWDKLTMGEFAIGTNTSAYAIAQKYGIGSRLPILIYEKMGPHMAIGDPCFARSEDAAIYNMYDHKEMVCRENEVTGERKQKNVYFGKHIDITLPYHQVEYLRGVRADGSKMEIIGYGRFVLAGTDALNEGLCAVQKEEQGQ